MFGDNKPLAQRQPKQDLDDMQMFQQLVQKRNLIPGCIGLSNKHNHGNARIVDAQAEIAHITRKVAGEVDGDIEQITGKFINGQVGMDGHGKRRYAPND
ncbi:hypothetical protein GCM10027278_38230 [Paralcaligenes ginsengisoli]